MSNPLFSFPLLATVCSLASPAGTPLSRFHPFLLSQKGRGEAEAEAATDDRSPPRPRFFLPLFAMETARTFAASKNGVFRRTHGLSRSFLREVLVCTYGPRGKTRDSLLSEVSPLEMHSPWTLTRFQHQSIFVPRLTNNKDRLKTRERPKRTLLYSVQNIRR